MPYAIQQNREKMWGNHWPGGEKMLPEVVAEEVSVQSWEIFLLFLCGLTTSSGSPMVGLSGELQSNRLGQEGRTVKRENNEVSRKGK
jgi:hypothetical protein